MKFKTARQAWHDSMASVAPSPIARAAEIARLGADVQMTRAFNSTDRAAHMAQAGKVLVAIGTLPQECQDVGNWLYAPLSTVEQDELSESVHNAIWVKSGLCQDTPKRYKDCTYWMTRAVMRDYQDLVLGRRMRLQTPQAIRGWLADWHGIDIDTRYWSRTYRLSWRRLWCALDDLDAQALAPVAAVVRREIEAETV